MTEGAKVKLKSAFFTIFFISLFFGFLDLKIFEVLETDIINTWEIEEIHVLIELGAFAFALLIGVMIFVSNIKRNSATRFFLIAGFIGTAFLHFYHAVLSAELFDIQLPSALSSLIPWTWALNRSFLGVFILLSIMSMNREESVQKATRVARINSFIITVILFLIFSFCFFLFIPMPEGYFSDIYFGRPQEFFPALLFLAGVIAFIHKGDWKKDCSNCGFILLLITNLVAQVYMSFSFELFDKMFSLAHLLALFSYLVLILVLLVNIYKISIKESENEDKITAVFNNIKDTLLVLNRSGVIESCNPAVEKMFGYTEHQITGQNIGILLPHKLCKEFSNSFMGYNCYFRSYDVNKTELKGKRRDGSLFSVEVEISKIFPKGKESFLMVIKDVSERKEIERIKNEFISTVSHELRTPLTSIRGSLGLVASGGLGKIPEKAGELITIAINNSVRLVNLINDILDIEKIEAGKMDFYFKTYDLMPIIEQAIEVNSPYAEQYKVQFEVENRIPDVRVYVDQDRLIQVITNLLSNAAKFSKQGDLIKISVQDKKDFVRVCITDNGQGIPEKFKANMFKKFAQVDSSDSRQKGGSGLGLSICKSIVKKLKGNIDFISEEGKGSTFYFDLPIHSKKSEFIKDISPVNNDENRPSILICEDDRDIASYINLLLEQNGYNTEIAASSEEVMQKITENKYDAMTLDLILPDKDGLSLLREIRKIEKAKDLPVIVISVKPENEEIKGDLAVIDWINKPIEQEQLMSSIKRALCLKKQEKPKILHLEDDADVRTIVATALGNIAVISQAETLAKGQKLLNEEKFDLVIIDIGLQDGNGLDLLPQIKENSKEKIMTVIFSAHEVDKSISESVDAVFLKSRASNQKLIETVDVLITERRNLLCG